MKTIVHIGMPKTGSTALQGCLRKSAASLAERGLLYPKNPPGSRSYNHRLLLALIAPYEDLPRRMKGDQFTKDNIGAKLEDFLSHVRRQITRRRPDGLILSTEGLFVPLPDDRHATLRHILEGLGSKPSFVAYLRQPSQHYLSLVQQKLKASAVVRPPQPKAYRKVLESYDACFGPDAVSARLFHRDHLEKGDIVADFCKHYLAEFQVDPANLIPGGMANETLSAESMDVLQRYRAAFHAERNNVFTQDTNGLIAALVAADRQRGAGRPQLRPGVAEAIDYASHDCLWVRARFGVTFPGLDYDRLAAAAAAEPAAKPRRAEPFKLKELLVIDRALQAQLLDSLAQTPWADEDAARRAWLDALLAPPARRARTRPN